MAPYHGCLLLSLLLLCQLYLIPMALADAVLSPSPSPSSSPDPAPAKTQESANEWASAKLASLLESKVAFTVKHPQVKQICDGTDYSALCVSSILPYITGKADPSSVLAVAIKTATEHTKVALTMAGSLVAAAPAEENERAALGVCRENYVDAIDNLNSALDALHQNDKGTMNSMLSAAITGFSTCEDAYDGLGSPMATFDGTLRKMVSNCLAIVSQLDD